MDQDEAFLTAVKTELLSLRKRVRHETLQKLELLKQIKEYREKESSTTPKRKKKITVDNSTQTDFPTDLKMIQEDK